MVFDNQEEAERAYYTLLEHYMNYLVNHQIVTAQMIGVRQGIADYLHDKKSKGKRALKHEKTEYSILSMMIENRHEEVQNLVEILKHDAITLAGMSVDSDEFEKAVKDAVEANRKRAYAFGDTEGRKDTLSKLVINPGLDIGDDDEEETV